MFFYTPHFFFGNRNGDRAIEKWFASLAAAKLSCCGLLYCGFIIAASVPPYPPAQFTLACCMRISLNASNKLGGATTGSASVYIAPY